ncbi:MAG: tyrosine--tRNA ligase [Candidatus Woesearchaeota archaeon]
MTPDEKIAQIESFAEELIGKEELHSLFIEQEKTGRQIIAYDGFEPSGKIHIAQGLLRTITVNTLTDVGIHFTFYVADWFAMLNHKLGGDLSKIRIVGEYFIEVWKACGMDMSKVSFVWASDFIRSTPEYWETVLKLSTNATVQRVLRCGQIMGREESDKNPSSQILYPLMQAADIHHLNADIAQLGLDQRKVNMLARDVFPKIGLKPPIAIHHHMLLGLQKIETEKDGIDKKIAMKMSKSKPDTAIFMTDTEKEVEKKFQKAYCPQGVIEDNPVIEYAKYIVFALDNKIEILRPEKFGGNVTYTDFGDFTKAYLDEQLHPLDVKKSVATAINRHLQPIREHFKTNEHAKLLQEKVESLLK